MKFSLVLNRYHNCHVIIFSQYNISNVKLTSPNIRTEISRILYLREKVIKWRGKQSSGN